VIRAHWQAETSSGVFSASVYEDVVFEVITDSENLMEFDTATPDLEID
jgi:hypothetical protein